MYIYYYHEVFNVPQEVAKIDVEQVTGCGNHDVVVVPVPYALQ